MFLTAVLYGLWAALCLAATLLLVIAPEPFSSGGPTWEDVTALLGLAVPTGIVAALGWLLFHRNGRQPSRWGYAGLAAAVVVVTHFVVVGLDPIATGGPLRDLPGVIVDLATLLLLHAGLTVPVALAGTALFVSWNRRRAAAA
jgi:hypothetical protein